RGGGRSGRRPGGQSQFVQRGGPQSIQVEQPLGRIGRARQCERDDEIAVGAREDGVVVVLDDGTVERAQAGAPERGRRQLQRAGQRLRDVLGVVRHGLR